MAKGENTTDRFTHNENPPPPRAHRRHFLGMSAIGILAAPLGGLLASRNAEARGSTADSSNSRQ
jgi:hypothetical protein